ncbi:unnamed protein product [Effrenium voratum]|nr:unnamed protein product [Effrenium voratum]
MKQGQLCRNEEKLTRITELQRGAHAASLRALLVSVTFGRQRLQGLVQDILSCCMERLLPSIHEHQVAAATSAPPPRDAPARSNVKPRRQLEDAAEAPPVVGDMVCVQGLNSAAQYNDQNGTVKSVRPDGRIEIELVLEGEGDKVLAVRPENLRRLCPQQLPSQCSGLLGQGEALVLDEWDPRAAESDDTEAEVRPGHCADVLLKATRMNPTWLVFDMLEVQIVTRTKADSRPDDERQDRNRPPSRSLATNTRDKGAKQRISRDARVPPFVRCRFMDEDWRICADQVAPHLLESGDFTVVAALGCQGGGRSTVLSTLLSPYFYSEGATPSYHTFKVPLGIHSAQSFLEGQASPAGVDLCITTDRLVLLDAQPLFDSISASPDADLRSELFLNIFLASICHTILVVTDTAVDMQLWRFMRLLGSLKSKVPDLATWLKQEKQAPKEETKEVAPNLLVVFNNMSPDSEGALEEPVQSFLQRTEWKAGPIRCLTAPRLPGRSFQEMLCSEQAAALGARLRQNLFQQGNCQGCFGHSLQLTEKQWLHHVLDYWDFVQKHPAVQSYFDALMAGRLRSLDSPDPKPPPGAASEPNFGAEVRRRLEPVRLGASAWRQRLLLQGREVGEESYEELGCPEEISVVVLPYFQDKADELRSAAAKGNTLQVKKLLQCPQDPNTAGETDETPFTPLQCAAECGHLEVVQLLLQASACPDAPRLAPLWFASAHGHMEVVQCLLDHGASKDNAEQSGSTALLVAAANGCLEVVQCLLAYGADKDKADRTGITPLRGAAARGHLEVVRCLCQAGAQQNLMDHEGRTPLWMSAMVGHSAVARFLLQARADPDRADLVSGDTPLRIAAARGHEEIVSLLVAARADLDRPSFRSHKSPLLSAVSCGCTEIAKCLIEARADKEQPGYLGRTPLIEAAGRGDAEMVRMLVQAGAVLSSQDEHGSTALRVSAALGRQEVVAELLAACADTDLCDDSGRSPLSAAASFGQLSVVRLLLEARAEMRQVEKPSGATALHVAAEAGHLDVVRCLLDFRADPHSKGSLPSTDHPEVQRLLASVEALEADTQEGNAQSPVLSD